ncbi:MAG: NAD(P)/FAD-dependent oxidoreductase [Chamaesiphon sp.]|nr:NAD(P)/FAD-dependent oxidoreductase [Chamaesiphon sp.]
MSLEYDVVIIGETAAARTAAIEAVNLQARVALVLPQSSVQSSSDFYLYALTQIAKSTRSNRPGLQPPSSYPWQYAALASQRLEQQFSPGLLAERGVDVIIGNGEFCRRPQLAFNVNQRYLRARGYLMATGSVAHEPSIPGIEQAGYLTIDRLSGLIDRKIPLRWAIIGSELIGIELAQTLAKLGCQVKLIVETTQILPYENLETARLIQAQLEADGVQIYLATTVWKVELENTCKLVLIEDESIDVDEIFLALPDQPLLQSFNLDGVGVDYTDKGISIDKRLQTSHRQIYACGSVCGNVLGGYHGESLTQFEAKIAVQNILSWRKTKINYDSYNNLPWAVYTDPPLARVGMTINTAINSPSQDLVILKQYLKTCPQAIIDNITSGCCQIIVTHKGQIIGAEIVGQNAPELIQILALAIQQKLKIADLTAFPILSPSYTELIDQTAQSWYAFDRTQRQKQPCWRKLLQWWK